MRPRGPDILDTNTIAALGEDRGGGVSRRRGMRELLIDAARLQQALTQVLRIALDETLEIGNGLGRSEDAAGPDGWRTGFRGVGA